MLSVQANQQSSGLRLDKFLCQNFDISFALAQKIIRGKRVKVNGVRVDAAYRLNDSDQIEIFSDLKKRDENRKENTQKKTKISPEKIKNFYSWKVFEDENLLVINKPSGLAVQGGSGIEFCVDDILVFLNLQRSPQEKLQLVHRLDKDTSGILLIAKNHKSAEFLTESFRNKTIEKTYLALVRGVVKKQEIVIDIPLKKKFLGSNEKVHPDFSEGKTAITNLKLIKSFEDYSFLELNPITGRTHQLRVHCKEIGHPILNDVKYGGKLVIRKDLCRRLCLHAYKIVIPDYFGKVLEVKTEMPEFSKALLL